MKPVHINPDTMYQSPVFSQAVVVEQPSKLVFVGGQNGILPDGSMAGEDIASQTRQALQNVLTVLEAAGATPEDVVKLTILVVQGQSIEEGFAASREIWTQRTTVTAAFVAALGHPQALVEIEAVAAL
ncbi:MAG: RidA family protein [Dehalococcoidia bacterium]|nr:RidA family protein [Dehalococcoidia bacterium]